ncbi:MAG: ABC transporter substrate-binding protein [Christensenella sp.]|uniref:ABC transporter substrate-binding protein n=1 Tax=Christensenella sp. TaxID=1935934 RepID=UPI002B204C0C|nr:ABC transporter substrate-binding protein [Christensenella sp.]MEA5003525.1 ABC transporter substrate-binding protein [Christensenella sp.]
MKKGNFKVLAILVAVLMVVALVGGCGAPAAQESGTQTGAGEPSGGVASADGGSAANSSNETLKIGVDDSLTGTGAPYGLPASNAVKLAASEVNEAGGIKIGDKTYNIEVVVYDNKSDATEGVSTIQKLMDIDQVHYVLGWSSSTSTSSAAQQIPGKEVTMLVGNARSPQIALLSPGNLFRSATANCYDPVADCEYIKSLGINKVAVLAFFNDTGYSVHANNVVDTFGKVGVEVVAKETMNAGDLDLLSQMTNIANSGAEAVYMAGNIEESAMALRQLRELGSDIPMITFSSGTGPQWLETCTNDQMEGSYTIRPQVAEEGGENGKQSDEFVAKYEAMFGENPSQTATNGYDNFWILMAAMQNAGTTDWQAVNDALKEVKVEDLDPRVLIEYTPLEGGLLFDDLGQAYHPYTVAKWSMEDENWAYESTIGKELGPDFLHNFLKAYCEEQGIEYPGTK